MYRENYTFSLIDAIDWGLIPLNKLHIIIQRMLKDNLIFLIAFNQL